MMSSSRSPGSGKSNIINKLIGMPPEPNADALKAFFIDTPAFELDNFQTISMSLGLMFRRSIMLTGVIYTYDITVKCTPPDERNFAILLKMCGEGAIDRLRLVTTMWDDPSSPEATEAEHALKEKYAKSLLDAGSGYERFDNTPESAWKIVEGLGDKKQALKLQEEIVNNVVDWWKASAFVGIPGVRV
ncbi:hypothetical protein EDC04DRAFT_1788937 [Pisolithus marmoratus]|nr:hypothetical protein EDC04DRAFT_1788937 [Pisolithus marmoratus]